MKDRLLKKKTLYEEHEANLLHTEKVLRNIDRTTSLSTLKVADKDNRHVQHRAAEQMQSQNLYAESSTLVSSFGLVWFGLVLY